MVLFLRNWQDGCREGAENRWTHQMCIRDRYYWLKGKKDKAKRYAGLCRAALEKRYGTEKAYLEAQSYKKSRLYRLFLIALGMGEEELSLIHI